MRIIYKRDDELETVLISAFWCRCTDVVNVVGNFAVSKKGKVN